MQTHQWRHPPRLGQARCQPRAGHGRCLLRPPQRRRHADPGVLWLKQFSRAAALHPANSGNVTAITLHLQCNSLHQRSALYPWSRLGAMSAAPMTAAPEPRARRRLADAYQEAAEPEARAPALLALLEPAAVSIAAPKAAPAAAAPMRAQHKVCLCGCRLQCLQIRMLAPPMMALRSF
jgi:hypothetical protein